MILCKENLGICKILCTYQIEAQLLENAFIAQDQQPQRYHPSFLHEETYAPANYPLLRPVRSPPPKVICNLQEG
jgi:hypothetical protein